MGLGISNYEIKPKIVRSGVCQAVTIVPVCAAAGFEPGITYKATVFPVEYGETYINRAVWEPNSDFDELELTSPDGTLTFEYSFGEEQEWAIDITRPDGGEHMRFYLYSVFNDLYERNPYRGDLHAHSCRSDGKEPPAIVAANYRKAGFDFFALTDHYKHKPSLEAIEQYRDVNIDLKICPGEEIHSPGEYIHIVNFGCNYSVNEVYFGDSEKYHREIEEYSKSLTLPAGINALEYAYRKWYYEEIHKSGGFAIIPHPFWIHHPYQYNMRPKMLDYVFETGIFDAFELIGGQTVHENNLQAAVYTDQCAKGRRIPVVGSSDSHGTDPAAYFKQSQTIVFSETLEVSDICDAVKACCSVAIEHMPGEEYRVYGPYRMVKYARFLLAHYFPKHDELCFEEGRLMKEYAGGSAEAKDALNRLHGRTAAFIQDGLK